MQHPAICNEKKSQARRSITHNETPRTQSHASVQLSPERQLSSAVERVGTNTTITAEGTSTATATVTTDGAPVASGDKTSQQRPSSRRRTWPSRAENTYFFPARDGWARLGDGCRDWSKEREGERRRMGEGEEVDDGNSSKEREEKREIKRKGKKNE